MQQETSASNTLVVSGDSRILAAARRGLSDEQITCATSGFDALAIIDVAQTAFRVVVCDVAVPGMDIIRMLRALRARKFLGSVVFILGDGEESLARSAAMYAASVGVIVSGNIQRQNVEAEIHSAVHVERNERGRARAVARVATLVNATSIRGGIALGEIIPNYQPLVRVTSKRCEGVECLARWSRQTGVVSPADFIGVAETEGVIQDVTTVLMRQAFTDLAKWRRAGFNLSVSVNVSIVSLNNAKFADNVRELCRDCSISPKSVILEITESMAIANSSLVMDILTRLRAMGFGLAVDDFGTGHSGLANLRNLPFTEIKIDQSFVHHAMRDESARAICEASINLARRLDMRVVAEGIEDEEDLNFVRTAGVDYMQGYYIERPMASSAFFKWAHENYIRRIGSHGND